MQYFAIQFTTMSAVRTPVENNSAISTSNAHVSTSLDQRLDIRYTPTIRKYLSECEIIHHSLTVCCQFTELVKDHCV